jgi:hypothetical protein
VWLWLETGPTSPVPFTAGGDQQLFEGHFLTIVECDALGYWIDSQQAGTYKTDPSPF